MDHRLGTSFVISLLTSALIMKLSSLWVDARLRRRNFWTPTLGSGLPSGEFARFFFSPLLTVYSWKNARQIDRHSVGLILLRIVFFSAVLYGTYWFLWNVIEFQNFPRWTYSYFAAFPILLIGTVVGPVFQLLYLTFGRIVQSHHNKPIISGNLQEFWGMRWNTWISDWFRIAVFQPLRRRPMFATFMVFVASGVWHELVMNVPAYYIFGYNFFGSMMIYFPLQFVGIVIDRRFLRADQAFFRRLLVWIFVYVPCPLILHESALRMIGMWPNQ